MKHFITIILSIFFAGMLFAQSPARLSYQAVVRKGNGSLVLNSNVGMRLNILKGSNTGPSVYEELHIVPTNANGLITAEVGGGTPVFGDISAIDWADGPYFLKTEIDPEGGSNFSISGTSQLLSVPYALYAEKSGTPLTAGTGIEISNNVISNLLPDKPITLTGTGTTTVSGTYPDFVINSTGVNLNLVAGQGIEINGNTISSTGDTDPNDDITNTTAAGGALTGVFPNPGLAENVVESENIKNGTIKSEDLGSGTNTFGMVLTADGAGGVIWSSPGAEKILADSDKDTKIQVEKIPNENIIRFDLAGTEAMVMVNNPDKLTRLEFPQSSNIAIGTSALISNTTGNNNLAFGVFALADNISGYANTAMGSRALTANTFGFANTAMGYQSLYYNTTGRENTAVGLQALYSNYTGNGNTATGTKALYYNTYGYSNTSHGSKALYSNTDGYSNTGMGFNSLYFNTIGNSNTAFGATAMYANNEGNLNTAMGYNVLSANTFGNQNTAIGGESLVMNQTGSFNTSVGYNSGNSGIDFNNSTALGYEATATGSNMVRVGNAEVTSIGGKVGWTTLSDGRFKNNIQTNIPGLDFITKLRPVSYQINVQALNEFTGVSQRSKKTNAQSETGPSEVTTGFIAQEVEASAKELGFDFSGIDKPKNEKDFYGLRYAEFVVPLVKAVQEQQLMIEKLQAENLELKSKLSEIEKMKADIQQIKAAMNHN